MAKRGNELREHILVAAKNVFIEMGFERTTMDVVAVRAATSKRSLYAHFETKDKLFLAVLDLVRELYLGRIKTPDHYAREPEDAIALYCGRFLQMLQWEPIVRTCRLGIAESDRLPDASAGFYHAFFATTHERLAAFISERYALDDNVVADIAHHLLGRTVYPQFARSLFGVGELHAELPDEASIASAVDLGPIQRAIEALLPSGTSDADTC